MFTTKLRSPLLRVLTTSVGKRSRHVLKIPHETGCHKKSISLCARYMSTQPLSTSKDCEKEMNFDEPEIDLVLKAEEERLAGYNGIQVINSTGVRAVEFCRPDKGNYFTTSILQNLINKIDDFEKNWVANAIFLGSQSLYFFSAGVHDTDFLSNNEGLELDKTIQICSSRIYDFPEHIIALYGGFITGTPFGMLLGCHYRLGTPSLLLCLNEPTRGQIPLGCLALGFARYSTVSPTILKYLAVSGATIHSTDLYELGILTHLTDHKPHRGMQYGDTIVINDTKAIQPAHGEPEYLANMIDDLDINADFEDVRFHEAWDRFLTVPVSAPEPDPVEETNIQLIFDEVEAIFKEGLSLEESVQLLKKKREEDPDNVWVNNALKNLVKCSPFALKCWFQLVDESEAIATKYKSMVSKKEYRPSDSNNFYKQSHAKILALEVNISEALRAHQKDGKWVNSNISDKDKFDLSFYEDDPEEEVDMLEKKSLKQQAEERRIANIERDKEERELTTAIDTFVSKMSGISDDQVSTVFDASPKSPKDIL